ncbi:SUMO-interacting motif-containing protein 1 isoform X2 [Acanthopagrus latus]|uniref:SUMO-interacting motif-containing protein 1 isoform X2 n=1 Tax=Acanthopagrus latus TaxID=8177 RepID=UPI00187C7536|nr:SUMO-interacting motif-containing protein 1 isoform X2 [Acanthopagrus latus]
MEDVITLSSESDSDKEDSDVEIVGSYSNISSADPLPLTAVRVDVNAVMNVKVPTPYIDLTDPKWILPELKFRKRIPSPSLPLVDLTENEVANGTKQETDDLQPDGSQLDCGNLKPKESDMDSQTQPLNQTDEEQLQEPSVKLRRLSFLESHVTELKTSGCSVYLTKDCMQMSLQPSQPDRNNEIISKASLNGPHVEPSLNECPPKVTESLVRQVQQENSNEFTNEQLKAKVSPHLQKPADLPCPDKGSLGATLMENVPHEEERGDICSSMPIPSPTSPPSSQDTPQDSFQRDVLCANLEQPEGHQSDSRQSCLLDHPSLNSPSTRLNPSETSDLDSRSHRSPASSSLLSQVEPTLIFAHKLPDNTYEWQSDEVKADEASDSSDILHRSIPRESPLSVLEAKEVDAGSGTGTYGGDLEFDIPLSSFFWEEEGEEVNEESRFDTDFRAASRDDRHFVCPVALRKIMSGPAQALIEEENEGFGTPEVLCRQSLSLVYSTIDENYPEGTLQLLSDLLQPGYYPPKDITFHLLRGILLDPQCPYHLCVQAFNLLIRTQRHHMADKSTVPWDWELLTSVMANQDNTKGQLCQVVRMLMEYVVQTLEDDFQAKLSTSSLHNSIAKKILSCDQQFPRVRDVIKWLFSAIIKSTEHGESRERDEQIRMVSIFQRMLSLALEVDRCPALTSAKLSQELFHMLISGLPLRAQRMLLLESLQSKLLRCKLVEHLLDYTCPVKTSLPMSLSLLLHFMKNCTLAPDHTDGTEMWQRWEELVHLLWMLLLSYNKAMNGYLCSSVSEQTGRAGTLVYKQDDMVTKSAVVEAVESFLSRSQADIGQSLPLHVEGSLYYLQDHLLDVCQC